MRTLVLLLLLASRAAAAPTVAVTLDDLPFVGPTKPGDTHAAATERILATLAARTTPVGVFVTCSRIGEGEEALLQRWKATGAEIGNHSTAHRSVDDLGPTAWAADVKACGERLHALLGADAAPWFRYPFLQRGRKVEARDAAAAAVDAMGYRTAPVTIDTADWLLSKLYVEALEAGDAARAKDIAAAHVEHVVATARQARATAQRRLGRDVAHVLLLHVNALEADNLGAALDALAAEGFAFVPLSEAMEDPVYAQRDDYAGPIGLSWLYRLAPAEGGSWAFERGQMRAIDARFGAKPLPTDRAVGIGDGLTVRALAPDTLVVQHVAPWKANSLVVETRSGALLLADTPPTADATRALLTWLKARFGPRRLVVVNSHHHLDAAGGNAVLRAAGAEIWGADATAEAIAAKGVSMRDAVVKQHAETPFAAAVAATAPEPPGRRFPLKEGTTLDLGEPVRVLHPGHGHSADNVVVYLPERKLLFGGCAVVGMPRLGYLGEADLARWIEAVDVMRGLGATQVIPGHEDRLGAELLDHTQELLRAKLAAQ